MPIDFPDDYWIEIPGGRYTMGLLPDEARRLAEMAAEVARDDPPPEGKFGQWMRWQEEDTNVAWLTEYLLAHYPAREVEIAPFAIARRPVTNAEYRAFLAEVPELEPGSWGTPRSRLEVDPDAPVWGIDWIAAEKFLRWAGARMPFEAEWERTIRGPERALRPREMSSEGVWDAVLYDNELCADLWETPPGLDWSRWGEHEPTGPRRVVRRTPAVAGRSIYTLVGRAPANVATYGVPDSMLRLVRADQRPIPPLTELSRTRRALGDVRAFDLHVLRPALASLARSDIADYHAVEWAMDNELSVIPLGQGTPEAGATKEAWYQALTALHGGGLENPNRGHNVRVGFATDPVVAASHYNTGLMFVAVSRETFRRIPLQHGVFVWSIGYRLAEDGVVRAQHLAAFRMAFDGQVHVLRYQFRPGEVDTPLADITSDMIVSQVRAAFDFYDEHADSDRSPF